MNLPRFLDVKGNKKILHKYTNSKRKTGEDVCFYRLGRGIGDKGHGKG